jgi:hypothetical protein
MSQFQFNLPTSSNLFGDAKMPRRTMGPRSGLTPQATAFFQNQGLGMQLAAAEQLIRLESLQDNRKLREVQYETALLNLEEAREEARRKRESAQNIMGIQSEYDAVLGSNLSGREQRKEFGRLGVKYAGVMAQDPAVRNIHISAKDSITLEPRPQKPALSIDRYLGQGGNPAYIENKMSREQMYGESEIPADIFYGGLQQSKKDEATRVAERKEQEKEQAVFNKRIEDVLDMTYTPAIPIDSRKPATGLNVKEPAEFSGTMAELDSLIEFMPFSQKKQQELKGIDDIAVKLDKVQRWASQYGMPTAQSPTKASSTASLWNIKQ